MSGVIEDPWVALRQLTQARIALGRSGVSVPTSAQLAFQLAHAQARDAVHRPLDATALAALLAEAGHQCLQVNSACPDRATYLQRPDLGRRVDDACAEVLDQAAPAACDLAIVIADGLSALAIEQNALPFLAALRTRMAQTGAPWDAGPLVIARQARVAIGDDIGARLRARAVLVLIGERPGLSSPDSMGLYLTWAPRIGRSDAERNCISNVRPAGLSYDEAAYRLQALLAKARALQQSGVAIKDETEAAPFSAAGNFLLT